MIWPVRDSELRLWSPWWALLLTMVLLAGCGSDDVRPPPAELQDFKPQITFREVWSRDVGDGLGEKLPDLRPLFLGEQLYTVDYEGLITELNPEDGSRIREMELEREITAGLAGYRRFLYAVDASGQLVAWNLDEEGVAWSKQLSSEVVVAPVVVDGKVVTLTVDGRVAAFGAEDGLLRWDYLIPSEPALTLRGSALPVVYANTLIVGLSDGRVISLSLSNGELLWEQRVASPRGRTELERLVDVDGDLLLINGRLYSVAFQGRLVELQPYDGKVRWAVDASSYNNLAGDDRLLVLSSPEGDLIAYRADSGEEAWRSSLLAYRYLGPPVIWDNWVLVADFEGYVHAFDRSTGEIAGRFRPGDDDGIRAPLLLTGDRVIVYDNSGDISAWRLQ